MTEPVTRASAEYGVHSEVGTLRKVLVCAPGLAHERLTPTNCGSLLFDEVMWVQNARRDHLEFMNKMRDRGVDVVELHDLWPKRSTARGKSVVARPQDRGERGRARASSRAPARSSKRSLREHWPTT